MALAAGTISQVSVYITTASLLSAVATGGVGPYTYQWYRDITPGFTPGVGNILGGETALTLDDTGLDPETNYYYKVVATDTDDDSTATSNELEVTTLMSTTAGALSKVSVGQTTASLLSGAASGGTGPYTYQWYRDVTSGFSPGGGNILTGKTSLTLTDTGLTPSTQYYYKVVATDSGSVTGTSAALAVATSAAAQNQNQFAQTPVVGQPDLAYNYNTTAAQIDSTESGSLLAGQAVKIVNSAGGIPKVIACSANSDEVWGFINFDIKTVSFVAGDRCEVSQKGNVMYLQATAAIARGAQVQLDVTSVGGVTAVVGSSGARLVGFAIDKAAAGQLLRVELSVPSFTVA